MNRRRALAALAGAGLLGASGWVVGQGVPGGSSGLPVRVETVEAPGSPAGETSVPLAGSPTVVDLFATWCAPCVEQMAALGAVHAEYGERAPFVSVTNERVGGSLSRADVREWWQSHGGAWPVGLDPESDLMSALGADGLPFLAVLSPDGTVHWAHSGVVDAATLAARLDRVLGR